MNKKLGAEGKRRIHPVESLFFARTWLATAVLPFASESLHRSGRTPVSWLRPIFFFCFLLFCCLFFFLSLPFQRKKLKKKLKSWICVWPSLLSEQFQQQHNILFVDLISFVLGNDTPVKSVGYFVLGFFSEVTTPQENSPPPPLPHHTHTHTHKKKNHPNKFFSQSGRLSWTIWKRAWLYVHHLLIVAIPTEKKKKSVANTWTEGEEGV